MPARGGRPFEVPTLCRSSATSASSLSSVTDRCSASAASWVADSRICAFAAAT
jgi:hypothetical protein